MPSTVTEAADCILERVRISKTRAEAAMKAVCTELGIEKPPILSCYAHADGSFKIGLAEKNNGRHFIPHDFKTEEVYLVPWIKRSPASAPEILEHWSWRDLQAGKWVEETERLPRDLVDFLNCLLRLGFGFNVDPRQYGGLVALSETGEKIEIRDTGYGYITFAPFD